MPPAMRVLHVCIGQARPLSIGRRSFLSAIGKAAVDGPVQLGPLGLEGDEQADPSVHGGLDKAVYAYPQEHYGFWEAQRGGLFDEPLPPGALGENLLVQGLLENALWIGDELRLPDATLRVTAPREPCFKFSARMGLPDAGRRMMQALNPGFYLAVVRPGSIRAGDPVELHPGPRGLRVDEAFAARRLKHLRE